MRQKYKGLFVLAGRLSILTAFSIISSTFTGSVMANQHDTENKMTPPINKRFSSLQDYLNWAQNSNVADMPHYKEIAQGQYQITATRGIPWDKTVYTYEELKQKLGFTN